MVISRRLKLFSSLILVILVGPLATPATAIDRKLILDVVEVTWPGAASLSTTVEEVVDSIRDEVVSAWKSFTQLDGDSTNPGVVIAIGEIARDKISLSQPMNCSDNSFGLFVSELRANFYSKLNIVNMNNRSLVILSPPAGCIWLARADLGGRDVFGKGLVLQNTSSSSVIVHEIGHVLGLGHSNLLRCSDGSSDGRWGEICRGVEYGGAIDAMSNVNTLGVLSIYHQWRLGLITDSQVHTSWVNETVELKSSSQSSGIKGIFFRDGNSAYWLEYRRAMENQGFDSGLVIYRSDPPPYEFTESPLGTSTISGKPGLGVSTDMWMLNLNNFVHTQNGKARGSMVLPNEKSFTTFSGNIRLSLAQGSGSEKLLVQISRKTDSIPPPTPILGDKRLWSSPLSSVLKEGYEDLESEIDSFQLEINGVESNVVSTSSKTSVATYLDPFNQRKSLKVEDLPEGSYQLRVRSRDVWGNQSPWSKAESVLIDRSYPKVDLGINTVTFQNRKVRASLQGFSDEGSGLCRTALFNQDGVVTSSDSSKSAPTFDFPLGQKFSSSFETFDCLGNGIGGDLSFTGSYKSASENRRTGKWSSIKSGEFTGLKCVGKCSISATLRDNGAFLFGEGSAEITSAGKVIGRVTDSKKSSLRVGLNLSIGEKSRVVRVTGSNFAFYGLVQSKLEIAQEREISRTAFADPSLSDGVQLRMAEYGFRQGDFSNSWQITPMDRGTTLLDPTLDLCSATYKSESGRQYRRQVSANKVGSPYLFLSSEVVKYKDKSAADAALTELVSNYQACVKNKGGIERDGTFIDYTFTPMPQSNLELVPESSRVLVRAQIGKGVSARQLLAFYQFKDEIFTGLYVVKAGEIGFDDAEVNRWFEAASLMATRLETKY